MKNYYIASCSCGKDSLAMVYRLIEEEMPLDEIVFYDTGMEFNAIYKNWERLCFYVELRGIKTTILHPQIPFLCKMFDIDVKNRDGSGVHKGYSWCGGRCRWGTTDKLKALEKHAKQHDAIEYVGIAGDEWQRLLENCTFDMETYLDKNGEEKQRPIFNNDGCVQNLKYKSKMCKKRYVLAEWNMTEADCLAYCRERNVKWTEYTTETAAGEIDLYDILDRVSCWCCGNKNHWELWNYWKYLPEYWDKLKDLQRKTERPFKKPYSVFDLEKRFEKGYVPKRRSGK